MQGMIPFDPDTSCLFFDVDGTLIDIAPHPDAVVVPPQLVADLAELAERLGGALALSSGRTIGVLDRLFKPLKLPAAGAHGAEYRFTSDGVILRAIEGDLPAALVDDLAAIARETPGLLIEDKKVCVAVHYRDNPGVRDPLRTDLERVVGDHADLGLAILPGHFVYELKRLNHDKGTALAAFMDHAPFKGRIPIFLGDDTTDEKAFGVVPDFGGMAVSVTNPRVGAVQLFDTPSEVRSWISGLAETHRRAA